MKKILISFLCLILLWTMPLMSLAASGGLTVSDAQGQPGDVFFLTVTMNEEISGDTLGVQYTYDKELLKAVPASSSWAKQGTLQDFGTKDVGVWAASSPVNLQGAICVLAFAIKEDAVFNQTEVTCEVTVRDGDQLVGTYSAIATVTRPCNHSFGQWQNRDNAEHNRICSLCGAEETNPHQWDEGQITEKTNESMIRLQTFTCEICGGTKVNEIITLVSPTTPPAETNPPKENTKPNEKPSETQPVATVPTVPNPTVTTENNNQLEDFIAGVLERAEDGQDHSQQTVMTEPAETEESPYHAHDHSEDLLNTELSATEDPLDQDDTHNPGNTPVSYGAVLAVVVVIAALVGFLVLKKKR